MNELETNAELAIVENISQPNEQNTTSDQSDKPKLSRTEAERVISILHFYNKQQAIDIVLNLSSTGPYSWKAVQLRIEALTKSTHQEKQYQDGLIDGIDIGVPLTFDEIIEKVSTIRSDASLPSYSMRIKPQCIADLDSVFILERHYASLDETPERKTPKHIGYTPIVKLKPE